MSGEKSAQEGREGAAQELENCVLGGGSPGIGADSQSMRKIPMRYTRGEGRILLQWAAYEPGVVPGNPKWGIPDNIRICLKKTI